MYKQIKQNVKQVVILSPALSPEKKTKFNLRIYKKNHHKQQL